MIIMKVSKKMKFQPDETQLSLSNYPKFLQITAK